MSEFKLPDVGEGLTEAEIVSWRVAVGDTVAVNDVIVDIETAKSVVELPSPFEGTVEALLVAEGQTVHVGTPIISIGDGSPAVPAASAEGDAEAAATSDEGSRQAVLVGYGPRDTGTPQRRRRRTAVSSANTGANGHAPETVTEPAAPPQDVAAERAPALAKPPVRKRAKDLGIDLHDVPATGSIITREDVERFAESRGDAAEQPAQASTAPAGGRDTSVPVKGVRKHMAAAMVESAFTAPHATEWMTVDVSESVELIQRLGNDKRFADVKITPLTLAARAVCLAIRRTPEVNAQWVNGQSVNGQWDDDQVILRGDINLGIAAATPRGLLVPNIAGADQMGLAELAGALGDLTETARQGRTQPEQMSGGTFTITNVGVFGVDGGAPIINPGESAILALGAVNRRPWVDDDDQIVPRWVTTLAISFDHRVVDGEQGSRFLADVASILREPSLALSF